MTLEELIIKIRADARGVSTTLGKTKSDIRGVEDQATKSKKGMSGLFSGVGVGAGVAAAGIAGGLAVAATSITKYKNYLKEVKAMQRMTNATAEEASTIVGQMKLIGGEDLNTADALGRWAVNLAAARDAGSAQGKLMARLGIDLKTTTGEWRTGAAVLMEYREKMSGMEDATQRAADLQAMMGRGYRNILPWFTKTKDETEEYTKALKDMGMVMTQEDMDTWGKYMADEKMMSMLLTAMQIKIARLVIPALNALMPPFLDVLGVIQATPTPLLKLVTGLLALGAGLKLAFAAKTVVGNAIEMGVSIGRLAKSSSSVVQILPNFISGLRSAGAASSRYSGIAGTLGGKLRGVVDGLIAGVKAGAKWIAKVPSIIASNLATGASNVALTATYVALAAAIAATAFAVYEAIKAFGQMQDAIGQANKTQQQANDTNEKAYREGKITAAQYEENKAGIARDRSEGMVQWYNPASWLWHASGADYITKGPTPFIAGEKGAEHVQVTPVGKESREPSVLVTGNTFVGTSRDAERHIAAMVNRRMGRRVDGLQRGRFASA